MLTQFVRNKILAHLDVINVYIDKGLLDAPVLVEIDLTNVCNHDCPGCTGWRKEGGLTSQISTTDAKRIITEIKECGVKAITFTGGGDPTMHKDFDTLIRYAYDIGLKVGLITNGLAIKPEHLYNIVHSCEWIRVSWDAATPDLHDRIHYNGELNIRMKSSDKFWSVVNNTKMMVDYKKENNIKTTIGCAFLVGENTKYEIVSFAELAHKTHVDYCQYRPFHYSRYDKESEMLMKEARTKFQSDDFNVLFSEFKFNTLKDQDIKRSYNICHGSHFVTHIAANYNVYVCCHLMFSKHACIGSVFDRSFTDVWRDKKKTEIINDINVHKCLPLCRNDSANRILDTIYNAESINHKEFL